jgi:hypothetical protein
MHAEGYYYQNARNQQLMQEPSAIERELNNNDDLLSRPNRFD